MMVIRIIEAVIGFGLLVFVHELGHFLAAKWAGIRVERFSLGFVPILKKKWGETEYCLGAVPIGGYVKMLGEEPEPGRTPQPGDFNSQPVGKRVIVFVAGVTMNMIFGFLVFMAAYQVGVPVIPAQIGAVQPGLPAWKAGLRTGDKVVGIDGVRPPIDFEDLQTSVLLAGRGKPVRLEIERDGNRQSVTVLPEYIEELGNKAIGAGAPGSLTLADPDDANATKSTDALDFDLLYRAGMQAGDRIAAVQGPNDAAPKPISTYDQFEEQVDQSAGQAVRVFYQRPGIEEARSVEVSPQRMGPAVWFGVRYGSNEIKSVRSGSWADRCGLRDGDVIQAVNGQPVQTTSQAKDSLNAASEAVQVTVQRGGETVTVQVLRDPADPLVEHSIAFAPGFVVDSVWPGYPAEQAGVQPGDVLTEANGKPLTDLGQLSEALMKSEGKPVQVGWRHGDEARSKTITPARRWAIPPVFETPREILRVGVGRSIFLGVRKSHQWAIRVYETLRGLLQGTISGRHLSGPISIAYLAYKAASRGTGMFLYILGVLSVNLAVFNLLPVPVLDGGHVLFAGIEKLRGKPVDDRIRNYATYAGLALVLCLLVFASWNDISMFLGLR